MFGRAVSSKLRKTTSTLYSSEKDLDDDTFKKVVAESNQLNLYPIYNVDRIPLLLIRYRNDFDFL
nr:MAG TPA: hypothetical protein [Bacteriophage sp.]